jgi:hypothetical protein
MIRNIICFISGVYIAQEYEIPRISLKIKQLYEKIDIEYKKDKKN